MKRLDSEGGELRKRLERAWAKTKGESVSRLTKEQRDMLKRFLELLENDLAAGEDLYNRLAHLSGLRVRRSRRRHR